MLTIALGRFATTAELLVPILEQAYRNKARDEITSSGWALHTIETVLWAFAKTDNFEDGLILVINLAGDADTNGAIYGMLAGAHYGYDAIPRQWVDVLQWTNIVERVYLPFIEKVMSG